MATVLGSLASCWVESTDQGNPRMATAIINYTIYSADRLCHLFGLHDPLFTSIHLSVDTDQVTTSTTVIVAYKALATTFPCMVTTVTTAQASCLDQIPIKQFLTGH